MARGEDGLEVKVRGECPRSHLEPSKLSRSSSRMRTPGIAYQVAIHLLTPPSPGSINPLFTPFRNIPGYTDQTSQYSQNNLQN